VKHARPSSTEVSSSQKWARRESDTEALSRGVFRSEVKPELILSPGEDTDEEEDPSSSLRPRSRRTKGPVMTDLKETLLTEEAERPTKELGTVTASQPEDTPA